MLLQFSCSNHKSIKDKIIFSMVASGDDTNADSLKKFNNIRVVRIASIYGANGSGKSNLVSAIEFARNLIVHSLANLPNAPLAQVSHKLSDVSTPSKYEFQFVKDDVRFVYGFSLRNFEVNEEYLYYFPNNRRVKIFERIGMSITAGNRYKKSFGLSKEALKRNRLFLTCVANYANVDETTKAYSFFAEDLILHRENIHERQFDEWYEYTVSLLERHPEVRMAFLEMLNALDTGIVDLKAKVEDVDVNEIIKALPHPLKALVDNSGTNGVFKDFQVRVSYETFETDLMTEESTGIKQLFKILCPIIDILNNGRVLVYDEIEVGLHEKIVHRLIELFYALVPHKFAQLIFTTHDTSLLDMDLFRRDQIWFTQLTRERATELYSLVELRNVRKTEKLSKGYINGKYGAIPMLNKAVIDYQENLV